jgi:hypothetical protein
MDQTLANLFEVLCCRLEELKAKNPQLEMEDVDRSCVLIHSYLDGYKTTSQPEKETLPQMSYEELCNFLRVPRDIPKGHIGPTKQMVREAERVEKENSRRVDRVIQIGKDIDSRKKVPFF